MVELASDILRRIADDTKTSPDQKKALLIAAQHQSELEAEFVEETFWTKSRDKGPPAFYALTPVWDYSDDAFQISTAAIVRCMATGETLAGMGGGGKFLSVRIVDALDMNQNNHRPRVVVDAEEYESLKSIRACQCP